MNTRTVIYISFLYCGKFTGGGINSGFYFDYSETVSYPDMNYKIIKSLVDYFGTEEIEITPISTDCGDKSTYGFSFSVKNAIRNLPFGSAESNPSDHGPGQPIHNENQPR